MKSANKSFRSPPNIKLSRDFESESDPREDLMKRCQKKCDVNEFDLEFSGVEALNHYQDLEEVLHNETKK